MKSLLLLVCMMVTLPVFAQEKDRDSVLVFLKTKGFYHQSIPAGAGALIQIAATRNIHVDTSRDASLFRSKVLARYKAIVFLNTTGDVLDDRQQEAFQKYIDKGGGFMGIHSATDTEYDWPWYNRLVGAYFLDHPAVQQATVRVNDRKHLATRALPAEWNRTDEWYNFKNIQPDLHVLCTLDERTYEGGKLGANHPFAWYHQVGRGRAFYTAGGHTPESFQEPLFRQHLLGGLLYAMGRKK